MLKPRPPLFSFICAQWLSDVLLWLFSHLHAACYCIWKYSLFLSHYSKNYGAEIPILSLSISISAFGNEEISDIRGLHVNIHFISDMETQTFTYVIRWIRAKQCAVPTLCMLSDDQRGLRKVWNIVYSSRYYQSVEQLTNAFSLINIPVKMQFFRSARPNCFCSLEQIS